MNSDEFDELWWPVPGLILNSDQKKYRALGEMDRLAAQRAKALATVAEMHCNAVPATPEDSQFALRLAGLVVDR